MEVGSTELPSSHTGALPREPKNRRPKAGEKQPQPGPAGGQPPHDTNMSRSKRKRLRRRRDAAMLEASVGEDGEDVAKVSDGDGQGDGQGDGEKEDPGDSVSKHMVEKEKRSEGAIASSWILKFLSDLTLEHLNECFAREGIDYEVLLQLNEARLKEIGVPTVGERTRIMTAITALQREEVSKRAAAWDVERVSSHLISLMLGDYVPAFQHQKVDGTALVALTEDDLITLGMEELGVRRRLTSSLDALVHPWVWTPLSSPGFRLGAPNYFLSLRIVSPHIIAKLDRLQHEFKQAHPSMARMMVPTNHAHLTLFVMHCADDAALAVAQAALCNSLEWVQERYAHGFPRVEFRGVGTLDDRVMYVKVEDDAIRNEIRELGKALWLRFRSAGVAVDEKATFEPHLTVAKASKATRGRAVRKLKRRPRVVPGSVDKYSVALFGVEQFEAIELCAMQADGDFYRVEERIPLQQCEEQDVSPLCSDDGWPEVVMVEEEEKEEEQQQQDA